MQIFKQIILYTDTDGVAKFKSAEILLSEGTAAAELSQVFASGGYQLRRSPVGFRSQWHCTPKPQWVFILQGRMGIGLRDGTLKEFKAGEHFYSADTLPEIDGVLATFDAQVHGHWSCQIGDEPLVTLFVKD